MFDKQCLSFMCGHLFQLVEITPIEYVPRLFISEKLAHVWQILLQSVQGWVSAHRPDGGGLHMHHIF
jgi:hypothetical protein